MTDARPPVESVDLSQLYCFDHPWILHHHVFSYPHKLRGDDVVIGTPGRRTLQESSFISEDFVLFEYADKELFEVFLVQDDIDPRLREMRIAWEEKKKKKKKKKKKRGGGGGSAAASAPAPYDARKRNASGELLYDDDLWNKYKHVANRKLPTGLREGTAGAIAVYSYGNRANKTFRDMYTDDGAKNSLGELYENPKLKYLRDAPSHIDSDRLLHPWGGTNHIKAPLSGGSNNNNNNNNNNIVDLAYTDYIDAHIFTLKWVPEYGGLGLFTGTSQASSDGAYRLFTPNQRITRFFGRKHAEGDGNPGPNEYTQQAIFHHMDDSTDDYGLFTPRADEYRRLAHFLNHDAVNPSCFMITNADGYIDVVVHPNFRLNGGAGPTLISKAGLALPQGTQLTFDYGPKYDYAKYGFARYPPGYRGTTELLSPAPSRIGDDTESEPSTPEFDMEVTEAMWESLVDEFDSNIVLE